MNKEFVKTEIRINQMAHAIINEVRLVEQEAKKKGWRTPYDFKKYQELCEYLKKM